MNPDEDSLLRVAADLVHVSADIRAPAVFPKQPPPVSHPSDQEDAQTTEVPSDYQSDWYAYWSHSAWKWSDYRYRSKWGKIARLFSPPSLSTPFWFLGGFGK